MGSVRDLYKRTILEHSRAPRNFRALTGEGILSAELRNVTCGDRIVLAVAVEDDVLRDIAFQGSGCAISMASASVMTEAVKGLSRTRVSDLHERFAALVRDGVESELGEPGELAVFRDVARFPVRVACATLAWDVLHVAMAL
ncbi:SUF system NifU family Fe-S cluster assembly protein [Pendulispora rubella]|uniref:SUF system NifU family Fe-S cluster assembly protein n=1 Tax=Pendulispora rubella TaxID=2741070 RepID=A0ABZ2KYX8_9BACT